MNRKVDQSTRRKRGTVIAYFLVLLSVLTTGLLTTMAIVSGGEAQVAGMTLKRDRAFYAAEAGIDQAFWYLQHQSPFWRTTTGSPMTGTVGGATYSMTATGAWNGAVTVTSTGYCGSGQGASSITVNAFISPKSNGLIPSVSLGSGFTNSGNVTIVGNVVVGSSDPLAPPGNISTNGKLNVQGSLAATGVINASGSVNVSGNQSIVPASQVITPIVDTTGLEAGTYGPVTVIDVTTWPSKKGVYTAPNSLTFPTPSDPSQTGTIYLTGPATATVSFSKTTLVGAGNLIVGTNLSIPNTANIGSSADPAPVNMIVLGALDLQGSVQISGSLIANGAINKGGALEVGGIVVGNLTLSANGGMNIYGAQPPSFVQYPSLTGTGALTIYREVGPIFSN